MPCSHCVHLMSSATGILDKWESIAPHRSHGPPCVLPQYAEIQTQILGSLGQKCGQCQRQQACHKNRKWARGSDLSERVFKMGGSKVNASGP